MAKANEYSPMTFGFQVKSALNLALDSIRAHKLRSFLTLLGVILGVASVVVVGSAINGLSTYASESTTKAFGGDSFLVSEIAQAGNMSRREFAEKLRYNREITGDDVAYLKQVNGDRVLYTPYESRTRDVKSGEQTFENAVIIGADYTIPDIRDVTVVEGRFYSETEQNTKQLVCVIGQEIKDLLFPGGNALGQEVKINGIGYRVVGVQEKLGSAFGNSQDNQVYIPAPQYFKMFAGDDDINLFGKARPDSGLTMDDAIDLTRAALRARFHTRIGKPDNFDTLTPDAVRGFLDKIIGAISAIVLPVTGLSLVVGGIVIMNIMLVSVTERTREIGIRKSIGATSEDILLQVLLEALILAIVGGLFGIALAWLVAVICTQAFGTKIDMSPGYVLLGVFVSTGVGLISGWYPAQRAAKLDPIVALRQE
jgi:putative ABC transport system permease protein